MFDITRFPSGASWTERVALARACEDPTPGARFLADAAQHQAPVRAAAAEVTRLAR
jgi:hypothetical protein